MSLFFLCVIVLPWLTTVTTLTIPVMRNEQHFYINASVCSEARNQLNYLPSMISYFLHCLFFYDGFCCARLESFRKIGGYEWVTRGIGFVGTERSVLGRIMANRVGFINHSFITFILLLN